MIKIEPSVVAVRRPLTKRIASFLEHIYKYKFNLRMAWIASRAERLPVWKMEITKEETRQND